MPSISPSNKVNGSARCRRTRWKRRGRRGEVDAEDSPEANRRKEEREHQGEHSVDHFYKGSPFASFPQKLPALSHHISPLIFSSRGTISSPHIDFPLSFCPIFFLFFLYFFGVRAVRDSLPPAFLHGGRGGGRRAGFAQPARGQQRGDRAPEHHARACADGKDLCHGPCHHRHGLGGAAHHDPDPLRQRLQQLKKNKPFFVLFHLEKCEKEANV